jgi:hypothetical protein
VNLAYPTTVAAIPGWAAANGVGVVEARRRFAQYAVLRGIARSDELRGFLVFKGGNALDFVYRPSRSTIDLDFSADMDLLPDRLDIDRLRALLAESIESAQRDLGLLLRVQRVEQQPPGAGRTFVTYHATIGYALPHEARLLRRMRIGEASPTIVPVDVSLNEPICASRVVDIDDGCSLRVSDIEDIVAESFGRFVSSHCAIGGDRKTCSTSPPSCATGLRSIRSWWPPSSSKRQRRATCRFHAGRLAIPPSPSERGKATRSCGQ